MKNKLNLEQLNIQSFVTGLQQDSKQTIVGGISGDAIGCSDWKRKWTIECDIEKYR